MQLINAPAKLVLPFANAGAKNTIPTASQIGIVAGAASLTDGFPPLTRTPLAAGGTPPSGLDMNGVLFELSAVIRWANAGGGYIFDSTFANDANVTGYPKGARVLRTDGAGYWLNTVDANVTDPESAGAAAAGWVPDFTSGASAITMTGSNVTLTALQYGKPLIIISGLLTANLNLIFPSIVGQWTVINNTTGAFTITAKTAAGTGVVVNALLALTGDGTNIYTAAAVTTVPAKNFLINGQMIVDQRNAGASQTYTAAAAIAYNLDMWYGSCTGANITGARLSAVTGGYRYTGAASNTGTLHGTRMRGVNAAPLVSQVVTGQVKASSSSITSVTWNAYSANAVDNFSAKTLIATGTLTITSTPTNYSFTFNAGANAANGVAIEFVTGALLGSQTLTYERAKLGDTYAFQEVPYEQILAACKPYAQPFRVGYLGDTLTVGNAYGQFVNFPVEMWAVPTVTLLSDVLTPSGFNTYPAGTTIATTAQGCGATRTATSTPAGGAQWAGNYFATAPL